MEQEGEKNMKNENLEQTCNYRVSFASHSVQNILKISLSSRDPPVTESKDRQLNITTTCQSTGYSRLVWEK